MSSALPLYGTAMVGREGLVRDLSAKILAGHARIETLLGTAGVGKTRLAAAVAADVAQSAGHTAHFCDLGSSRSRSDVGQRIVESLGVQASAPRVDPIELASRWLQSRGPAICVLDNFEHLAQHAESIVGVLAGGAPAVTFVITARSPLGLSGESTTDIRPLDVPDAVRLFLERVRASTRAPAGRAPESPEDLRLVADVVRRLEGLPLAIELAAARLDDLSLPELHERLDARFLHHIDRPSAPDGRLWTAIDWVWQLLTPAEQSALAQCATFEGGFDLAAAEAVIRVGSMTPGAPPPDPAGLPPRTPPKAALTTLEVIQSLCRQSLLRAQGESEPRFSMLQAIRTFAAQRLAEQTDPDAVGARHAAHYLGHGTQWVDHAHGPDGPRLLDQIARELDNFSAVAARAMRRAPSISSAREALGATLVLSELYTYRGRPAVHLRLLEETIAYAEIAEHTGKERLPQLGWALRARAQVRRYLGETEIAQREHEAVLARARRDGDRRLQATVLSHIGNLHQLGGRYVKGLGCYDEALRIDHAIGDRRHEGRVVAAMGLLLLERAQHSDAWEHFLRALAILREVKDVAFEPYVLGYLATASSELDRLDDAESFYEAARFAWSQLGNRRGQMTMTGGLGIIRHLRGDLAGARELYVTTIAEARAVLEARYEGYYLAYLGRLDVEEGALEPGRESLRSALAIAKSTGDVRYQAIILAGLAAELAAFGDIEEAERALGESEQALMEVGDDTLMRMAEIGRALLAVRLADGPLRVQDRERADTLLEIARKTAALTANSRSDDVRLSRRLLMRCLTDASVRVSAVP